MRHSKFAPYYCALHPFWNLFPQTDFFIPNTSALTGYASEPSSLLPCLSSSRGGEGECCTCSFPDAASSGEFEP